MMSRNQMTVLVWGVLGLVGCTQAPPPHALEDAVQASQRASAAVNESAGVRTSAVEIKPKGQPAGESGTSPLETDQKGQSPGEAGAN